MRVDLVRCSWKLSRSFLGTILGLAVVAAILRMIYDRDRTAVLHYICKMVAGLSVTCVRRQCRHILGSKHRHMQRGSCGAACGLGQARYVRRSITIDKAGNNA